MMRLAGQSNEKYYVCCKLSPLKHVLFLYIIQDDDDDDDDDVDEDDDDDDDEDDDDDDNNLCGVLTLYTWLRVLSISNCVYSLFSTRTMSIASINLFPHMVVNWTMSANKTVTTSYFSASTGLLSLSRAATFDGNIECNRHSVRCLSSLRRTSNFLRSREVSSNFSISSCSARLACVIRMRSRVASCSGKSLR